MRYVPNVATGGHSNISFLFRFNFNNDAEALTTGDRLSTGEHAGGGRPEVLIAASNRLHEARTNNGQECDEKRVFDEVLTSFVLSEANREYCR